MGFFPPKILSLPFSPLCLLLTADSFSKRTPCLLPSFSFLSSQGPGKRTSSLCAPTPPSQPNISPFPVFFSLTSNSPLLNHPPSSPFTSQLLFLSPSHIHVVLSCFYPALSFFLLFPLLSSTFRSSFFLRGATWILGASAGSAGEGRASCSCVQHQLSLPCGLCSGCVHDSTQLWAATCLVTLCSWHVDSPSGLLWEALLCSWEMESLETLAVKFY